MGSTDGHFRYEIIKFWNLLDIYLLKWHQVSMEYGVWTAYAFPSNQEAAPIMFYSVYFCKNFCP